MQPKNSIKFTTDKLKWFAVITFKKSLLISLACCMLLFITNCKKLALLTKDPTAIEQFFEENVLNKNFVVNFASDNSNDITSTLSDYTFSFSKTTSFYEGTVKATKNGTVYNGTWSSNSDFSKLVINITNPTIPPELVFVNRAWKFTKKDPEIMKLAPWDDNSAKILYIKRL